MKLRPNPAPGAPDHLDVRRIKVFVSSTFRDMHEDRDQLNKFVFPRLRKLCESRGVTWGEVDLRWGITDQETAEGRVLPICLEEIGRCRPFLIGILGERYGSVVHEIGEDLVQAMPWLAEYRGRSVTEIEILHGVLRNPEAAGHAFFYFRDPRYADRFPPDKRADFQPEDEASARKLDDLKTRIKASGVRLVEDYKDPRTLGELVMKDMTELIDRLYPESDQPTPSEREILQHRAFADAMTRFHVPRMEYVRKLERHAGSDGATLIVTGHPGSGKSALLANWLRMHAASCPEDVVAAHWVGASPAGSDWWAVLRTIMIDVAAGIGVQCPRVNSVGELRAAFVGVLSLAAQSTRYSFSHRLARFAGKGQAGRRIVIVIDGLDRLRHHDLPAELTWLRSVLPPGVRMVLSAAETGALGNDALADCPVLKVQDLSIGQRERFVTDYLDRYSKKLGADRVSKIVDHPCSGNPSFLNALLGELRLSGDHAGLEGLLDRYLRAAGPSELYGMIIDRWESDFSYSTNMVKKTLCLLWAARRGLTETEIREMLGDSLCDRDIGDSLPDWTRGMVTNHRPFAIPGHFWSPFYIAMEGHVRQLGGLVSIADDTWLKVIQERYMPTAADQAKVREWLAEYFREFYWRESVQESIRCLEEVPSQYLLAGDWDSAAAFLSSPGSLATAWYLGGVAIIDAWSRIEANSPKRMVDAYSAFIRCPDGMKPGERTALASLLVATGHLAEASALSAASRPDPSSTQRDNSEGETRRIQGDICMLRGDIEAAMGHYQASEDIFAETGSVIGLYRARASRGHVLVQMGRLAEGEALLAEAESAFRKHGDVAGLAACLGNKALLLMQKGLIGSPMLLLKEQEDICRRIRDFNGLQTSIGNQATLLLRDRKYNEGMARLAEQEEICVSHGFKDGLARCLVNRAWGMTTHPLGVAFGAAVKEGRRALDIAREGGFEALANEIQKMVDDFERLERQSWGR